MKNVFLTLLTIGVIILTSCEDKNELKQLDFDISGAKAILYSQSGNSSGRVASTQSYIFKLDGQGNLTSIIDDVKIIFIRTLSDGLFVVTDDERKFYVKLDNTSKEITENVGGYKGENLNGDLIFENAKILRKSTMQVESIQSTLTMPRIQSVSGNYAILTDNSIFQILNTVNGIRYNVNGCNGPRMLYLNEAIALIDDCQSKILIDMTNGARSTGDSPGWNHEGVTTPTGVVLLGQGLDGVSTGYLLGLVNSTGNISLLSNYEFSPGSESCMNCGLPNEVLYNTGDYFIVRELNKVTVIKKGDQMANFILAGYNVTSISVDDNLVYYLAEDNTGTPITGVYNLLTETNQVIESTLHFDNIQTFN